MVTEITKGTQQRRRESQAAVTIKIGATQKNEIIR